MIERLCNIDLDLAQAEAEKAGAPTPTEANRPNHGRVSASLSITSFDTPVPTIATRRVAIIVG